MSLSESDQKALIDAALGLAAARGWRGVSLGDIAAAANLPLVCLYPAIRSKTAILDLLMHGADQAMLRSIDPAAAEQRVRDRLFEAIMARLDYLAPYKPGLKAIVRSGLAAPSLELAVGLRPAVRRGLGWLLEATGLDSGGVRGRLRMTALGLAYGQVFQVWLGNDSPDLGKTMAALDRVLLRLDRVARSVEGRFARLQNPTDPAAEPGL